MEQKDKSFGAVGYVRRDLARPFIEPYKFCGAWVHYSFGQSAVLGVDLPGYVLATLVRSAANGQVECVDALMSPRGCILSTVGVLLVWSLVGHDIRRRALGRWWPRISGTLERWLVSLGLILGAVGGAFLFMGVASVLFPDSGLSVRAAGIGLWFIYVGALAAERLRSWPFGKLRPEDC